MPPQSERASDAFSERSPPRERERTGERRERFHVRKHKESLREDETHVRAVDRARKRVPNSRADGPLCSSKSH
jgi:hypothetical protein